MAERVAGSAPRLRATSPEGLLYRIARRPNPWVWPDWAYVGSDGTFGNRWDDPQGLYRVLYASSSRLGALVEVLARFRPDPHVQAALEAIEGDDPFQAPGALDPSWLERRCVGTAQATGSFVDVGHSRSLAELRRLLASRLAQYGVADLDAAAIRLAVPRALTQEISRAIYGLSTEAGERRFAGIAYRSRLGDEFRNWAIFESTAGMQPTLGATNAEPLVADDADLCEALSRLGIRLLGQGAMA